MIRAIALDDDRLSLRLLECYCSRHEKVDLQRVFTDHQQAAKHLRKFPADLLFLDINMPAVMGTEFYQSLTTRVPVIFTTAHSEFAVQGFDLKAVDYLVKPFAYERFEQAIERVLQLAPLKTDPAIDYFSVRSDYSLVRIKFDDVKYIESLDDYLTIHMENGSVVITRMTLTKIAELLPDDLFVRVHRSYIVARKHIAAIRNKMIHLGEIQIPIGASYQNIAL